METVSFIDRECEGCPRLLGQAHYIAIDNAMDVDNELTTQQLMDVLLSKFPDLRKYQTAQLLGQDRSWVGSTRQRSTCIVS